MSGFGPGTQCLRYRADSRSRAGCPHSSGDKLDLECNRAADSVAFSWTSSSRLSCCLTRNFSPSVSAASPVPWLRHLSAAGLYNRTILRQFYAHSLCGECARIDEVKRVFEALLSNLFHDSSYLPKVFHDEDLYQTKPWLHTD
jgi:hypothetical protein